MWSLGDLVLTVQSLHGAAGLAVAAGSLLHPLLPARLSGRGADGAQQGDRVGACALAGRSDRRSRSRNALRGLRVSRDRAPGRRQRGRGGDEPRISDGRRAAPRAGRRWNGAAVGQPARGVVPGRGGLRRERHRRHLQPLPRSRCAGAGVDRRCDRVADLAALDVHRHVDPGPVPRSARRTDDPDFSSRGREPSALSRCSWSAA